MRMNLKHGWLWFYCLSIIVVPENPQDFDLRTTTCWVAPLLGTSSPNAMVTCWPSWATPWRSKSSSSAAPSHLQPWNATTRWQVIHWWHRWHWWGGPQGLGNFRVNPSQSLRPIPSQSNKVSFDLSRIAGDFVWFLPSLWLSQSQHVNPWFATMEMMAVRQPPPW